MTTTTTTTETTETTGGPPPVVTFVNSKGGVGKTSLVAHLAGALADRGAEVLAVDMAPEGDLTQILGHTEAYDPSREWSLHSALLTPESDLEPLLIEREEFDLLPSNEQLIGEDTAAALAAREDGRLAFRRLLENSEALERYDIVLVDNEPRINALSDASIVAADGVIVPLYAEALSAQGLNRLGKQIGSVSDLGGGVEVLAFVLNRVEDNNQSRAVVENVRDQFGDDHAVLEVRKRVDLQRSLARDSASIFGSPLECDQTDVLEDLAEVVEDRLALEPDGGEPADGRRRMSNEEWEVTFDPVFDLAERWGISEEEAELFLEAAGYYNTERYREVAEIYEPTDPESVPDEVSQ